jgi:hypothetical protein
MIRFLGASMRRMKNQEVESDDVKIDFAWKNADDNWLVGWKKMCELLSLRGKVVKFDKERWVSSFHVTLLPLSSFIIAIMFVEDVCIDLMYKVELNEFF